MLLTSAPYVFSSKEERQVPRNKQCSGLSGDVAPVSGINWSDGQHTAGHLPCRRHEEDVKWRRVELNMRLCSN